MQIRNSFDRESVKKMIKGALIAMAGAAAIGLLEYVGSLEINNPILAMVVSFGVPTLVNIIREYKSGK